MNLATLSPNNPGTEWMFSSFPKKSRHVCAVSICAYSGTAEQIKPLDVRDIRVSKNGHSASLQAPEAEHNAEMQAHSIVQPSISASEIREWVQRVGAHFITDEELQQADWG